MHQNNKVTELVLRECSSVKVTSSSFPLLFVGQSAMVSVPSQHSAGCRPPLPPPSSTHSAVTLRSVGWTCWLQWMHRGHLLQSVCSILTQFSTYLRHHNVTLERIRNKDRCLIRSRFKQRARALSAILWCGIYFQNFPKPSDALQCLLLWPHPLY